MGTIYIASKPVVAGQEHLYLVYDKDGIFNNGDETVIRGGPQYDPDQPEWYIYNWGNIVLEVSRDLEGSEDRFNIDGVIYTPSDRNFTKLNVPDGMTEESVWNSWVALANGVQDAQHDYNIVGDVMTNSNSTVATMLYAIGLDIQDVAPILNGDLSWDPDSSNDVTTGRMNAGSFPGDFSILDTALDTTFTVFKIEGVVYSSTVFFKIDGSDTIIMENGAELEVRNVEESDGLTRIVLKEVKYSEVGFSDSGDDLTVTDKSNWNPLSDDIIRLPDYGGYKGYNNTEFVFDDGIYRIGTNGDDSFTLNSVLGGVIDGRGGDDRVTYKSGGFYDQQNNVMWNENGTVHDTLKNIESVNARYAVLVVDSSKSQIFSTDAFAGYDYRLSETGATFTITNHDDLSSTKLSTQTSVQVVTGEVEQSGLVTFDSENYREILDIPNAALILNGNNHKRFYGTNHGDAVFLSGNYFFSSFYGGTGNDLISIDRGNGFSPQIGYLDIHYTGGADTISGDGAGSIKALYLDNGILIGEVSVSLTGDTLVLTDSGKTGNVLTVNGFYHGTKIIFSSGGEIDVNASGVITKIGTSPDSVTLYGTVGDDTWVGRSDINETYYGHGGNDTLSGNGGNDTLNGGGGNDALNGGAGDDTLIGGDGNDTYIFAAGDGHDHLIDTIGNDVLLVKGDLNPEDFIYTKSGNNLKIEIASGVVIDGYYRAGSSIKFIETEGGTRYAISDLAQGAQEVSGDAIFGTSKDDVLVGDEFAYNLILAGGGNDQIYAGLVDNDLYGGRGNDTYYISASAQSVIHDTEGSNHLVIDGISLYAFNAGFRGNTVFLEDLFGNTFATIEDIYHLSSITFLQDNTTISSEDFFSFDFNPYFVTEEDDFVDLSGAFTSISLALLGGDDTLYGSSWGDIIHGNDGDDTLNGSIGNDTYYGDSGNDILFGNEGDDALSGGEGDDDLYGDQGNDTLDGGSGYNHLYGGEGNDTYLISQGSGTFIDDSWGMNRIIVTDVSSLDFNVNSAGTGFYTDSFDTYLDVGYMGNISQIEFTQDHVVWIPYMISAGQYGFFEVTNHDDNLDARFLQTSLTVDLQDGNDRFYGTDYNDSVMGGLGNDVLDGYAGDDMLYGGYGTDSLIGGAGHDQLFGGADNDSLNGNEGDDLLVGGAGDDFLSGGEGDDTYLFDPDHGNDTIAESVGVDTIRIGGDLVIDDLVLEQSGNHLIIHTGADSSIKIINQFTEFTSYIVEWAEFDDGSRVQLPNGLSLAENVAPVLQDDVFTLDEDTVLSGNVLVNDTDADGDTLLVQAATITTASGATVTLLENGDFTYTPLENFNGADSFTYTARDGHDHEETATVSLTVLAVNDDPVAMDDQFTIHRPNSLTGNLLLNDKDVDGDILSVVAQDHVTTASRALLTVSENGDFTYSAIAGFTGHDSFSYEVSDGQGGTATSLVDIEVTASAGSLIDATGSNFLIAKIDGSILYGLGGNDLMFGRQGADQMFGGAGNDMLNGNSGHDLLIGGAGSDSLYGGYGHDILVGGDVIIVDRPDGSVDYFYAGIDTHNDTLFGGSGNDLLIGSGGQDLMVGGSGADTYMFIEVDGAADVIYGFNTRQGDKIDLSNLLDGYDPLSDAIADFVQVTTFRGQTTISVDVDGGADNFVNVVTVSGNIQSDLDSLISKGTLVV
ncbi:MAG: tandem-95 repeat protein [Alphaproteobacteria bacterium]|nr:tandem-95 repeat protein [Alphaproteobacteria bacterium]